LEIGIIGAVIVKQFYKNKTYKKILPYFIIIVEIAEEKDGEF
jgi:hypothetical protein